MLRRHYGAQQVDFNLTKVSGPFVEVLISQLMQKICLMSCIRPVLGIWKMPVQSKHKGEWADPKCNNPKMQCRVCMWHGTRPA